MWLQDWINDAENKKKNFFFDNLLYSFSERKCGIHALIIFN